MDEQAPVEPWPRWLRITAGVAFGVVIAAAVVVMLRGGVDGSAIRIALAVVLAPAVAAVIVAGVRYAAGRRGR